MPKVKALIKLFTTNNKTPFLSHLLYQSPLSHSPAKNDMDKGDIQQMNRGFGGGGGEYGVTFMNLHCCSTAVLLVTQANWPVLSSLLYMNCAASK